MFWKVRPLSYWNSREWKPSQTVFIRANRLALIKQLDKAFESGQISNYQKEMVLKEISANITKEMSSFSRSYLVDFLRLADEDIEGIKMILYDDLRVHYEEKMKHPEEKPLPTTTTVSVFS